MASVSSLDQDMRKLRLERYTPAAANEVRQWIENTLGEKLAGVDLMESLRDGVALCKLVNLIASPGVRFKASSMPFVQMENISHFLRACELAPLNLPSHDRFLTVDLYDQKDPAQVLQCIAAFSRRANAVNPAAFPTTIGAKSKGGAMSPQGTGGSHTKSPSYTVNAPPPRIEPVTAFNPLNKAAYSGRISPSKQNSLSRGGLATGGSVSSWSKPTDEDQTAPAWNIHQYGYMGGASQGNQGVAFGARRQITTAAPEVPSLAEKEKRLRENLEAERARLDEEARKLQHEAEQDELKARAEEERRWEEETQRQRQLEARDEEVRRRREIEAREEQASQERALETKMATQRNRQRQVSDSRLNGQSLSQYKSAHEEEIPRKPSDESRRIAELERQLAEMREAENQRQRREQQEQPEQQEPQAPATQPQPEPLSHASHEDDWDASEREYLKKQSQIYRTIEAEERTPPRAQPLNSTAGHRPLPDPSFHSTAVDTNRTDRYLATNPAPHHNTPSSYRADNFGTTTEVDIENQRREASQQKTKAGAWASKSLLEREMERERERQREWEENQKATAARTKDVNEGSGAGQSWDIHQYGYMGGDSQNRGGTGLGASGARRQIIGPRPPP